MEQKVPKHLGLVLAFFGGMVAILVLQDEALKQPATTTIIQLPQTENAAPLAEEFCDNDNDCPVATTYCDAGLCTLLSNPVCECTQQRVMRCAGDEGNVRHIYCSKGCSTLGREVRCQQ